MNHSTQQTEALWSVEKFDLQLEISQVFALFGFTKQPGIV